MEDLLRNASRIAISKCMNVKPDEKVLIITDNPCEDIGKSLWNTAKEIGNDAVILEIFPRDSHGEEPPQVVSEFMKIVDVILIPTSKSLSHTDARRNASREGVRIATLPGISKETMIRTLNADYDKIAELSSKVATLLSEGSEILITTELGTEIKMDITNRKGLADTGLNHNPGNFSNLPAGEGFIAPLEGKSNGRIIFDGSMSGVGLLIDEIIDISVVDGYAIEIGGGKSAKKLLSIMEPHGKLAFNLAELGIGTNDKAEIVGNILEDEKAFNTIHIAFGDNKSMGGTVRVASHLDGVVKDPNVYIDNKQIMSEGELLV